METHVSRIAVIAFAWVRIEMLAIGCTTVPASVGVDGMRY